MNIKNSLLSVVKNRWFERGLCLVILFSLTGFLGYRLSAQQKQLENYSLEIENYSLELASCEENEKNLNEKLDLSGKEIIRLNQEISDYQEKSEEQLTSIRNLYSLKYSLEEQIGELESNIDGLKYMLPNENEIIIDIRIDPDILSMLIKHAKALNERDYETYKSTWFSGYRRASDDGGWFSDFSSEYHYEEKMIIKKICLFDYQVDGAEQCIFIDMTSSGMENSEETGYFSYSLAVIQDNGQWYVTNYH